MVNEVKQPDAGALQILISNYSRYSRTACQCRAWRGARAASEEAMVDEPWTARSVQAAFAGKPASTPRPRSFTCSTRSHKHTHESGRISRHVGAHWVMSRCARHETEDTYGSAEIVFTTRTALNESCVLSFLSNRKIGGTPALRLLACLV